MPREGTSDPRERPVRVLDLFCGAGGASKGYAAAGFEVVGVDEKPQPNYPFEFHQCDALLAIEEVVGRWWPFDAIAASPPCQASSAGRHMPGAHDHVDLIPRVRERLIATGLPYVIENVVGAALRDPITLCAAAFGLGADGHDLARHRLFEVNFPVMAPPCAHGGRPVIGIYGDRAKTSRGPSLAARSSRWSRPESLAVGGEAMGIDWMTWRELREAIPPAYTEHIGGYLMAEVARREEARDAA